MNNPFWEYSLSHYAREGVAEACLALQDGHGLDVNMLLYGAWLGSMGQPLEPGHLSALEEEIRQWRERVVLPLRTLRREWRDYPPVTELRERLKEMELEAEHRQQDRMLQFYRSAPALPVAGGDTGANLRLVAEFSGNREVADWSASIERLRQLLAG